MRTFFLIALLLTAAPVIAEAQSTVTNVQASDHADPNAWRRNDNYMGGNNRRMGNAGVSNHDGYRNNDGVQRFGRNRNGNAGIVTQSNNNNNRNNSQTNGITIINTYSVPSNVTNTAGSSATTTGTTTSGASTSGNARVTTP